MTAALAGQNGEAFKGVGYSYFDLKKSGRV